MLTDFPVWQQLRIFSPNPRHFTMRTFGLVQRVIRAWQLCSYSDAFVHMNCFLIQSQSYWLSRALLSNTTLLIMIQEALCDRTCLCIESISTMTTRTQQLNLSLAHASLDTKYVITTLVRHTQFLNCEDHKFNVKTKQKLTKHEETLFHARFSANH